ncbi:Trk system potassium transporter TrkA [Dethiobacter alkaliphilus]|uniref:TrkA-N domain protein n=1 Tax=Dethiobacter alkaliphilus AHT 1 TaxID=555088 RepID=C0GHH3_DETAL|nr:Trk system potassium transporter TrkA [Dethiobacter alkaliphilus]EEG77179.1 TrkA-N domain protein [Dethiobacter alkaliphilus AHT 1]
MVIAVTETDETNIIACMIAKTFNVPITVARVRNPDSAGDVDIDTRGLTQKQVGIDIIISPEKAVAQEISKMIHFPDAENIEYFAQGKVKMVGVTIRDEADITRTAVKDLPLPKECSILGIKRQNGDLVLPKGNEKINTGDKVYLVGSIAAMREASRLLYHRTTQIKKVLILGGGMIGYYLASILEENKKDSFMTKLIEKSPDRCEELNRTLTKTLIIQGDGTEMSYYNREELNEADVAVIVTGDDRINIVAAIIAQKMQIPKVITEVTNIGYNSVYKDVDITGTITPHSITAAQILRYTHKEDVVTLSLLESGAEVTELLLSDSASVTGKTIGQAKLPEGIRIGVIVRDEQILVPQKDTILQPDDRLVVISTEKVCTKQDKFFACQYRP